MPYVIPFHTHKIEQFNNACKAPLKLIVNNHTCMRHVKKKKKFKSETK